MMALNSLGTVERSRGNPQAALSWYERSLELAQRLGSAEGQATARSNRAVLLSDQAQAAADPDTRRRLLSQAIAEERECLALEQQMGQPASIAISHNNLANRLLQLAAECGIGFQPVDAGDRQDARPSLASRRRLNGRGHRAPRHHQPERGRESFSGNDEPHGKRLGRKRLPTPSALSPPSLLGGITILHYFRELAENPPPPSLSRNPPAHE